MWIYNAALSRLLREMHVRKGSLEENPETSEGFYEEIMKRGEKNMAAKCPYCSHAAHISGCIHNTLMEGYCKCRVDSRGKRMDSPKVSSTKQEVPE